MRYFNKRAAVTCGALLLLAGSVWSQNLAPTDIAAHISVLAADSLEGRGTGTLGEIKAANYIADWFKRAGLAPKGGNDSFFEPFGVVIHFEGVPHQVTARNVVGYLDNEAEQTIVIGAHYDHLGKGYQSGSLTPDSQNLIHNGADDNASGVAGLIELARHFAGNTVKEKYNLLFIAFSGEELGLLGSKFFVDHPTIPMESVAMMVNMDMVGRLDDSKGVTIGGWGTSPEWGKILPGLSQKNGLNYNVDSSGVGPSDHTSFYLKEKPVLFFFTGVHSDYHKPSDDSDRINAAGERKILQLIVDLVDALGNSQQAIVFTEAGSPHSSNNPTGFKVTLGIIPDYSFNGRGLRVDAVSKNRPAAEAGMENGDIIVKMGDFVIKDIYDYMDSLGQFEMGQSVEVEVRRKQENKTLRVKF
ncbi:M20/M25/M40 family metallo-hydrolase [Persicitalea jodogahamensis]|uniref:Aminopeptidase n=1 Tax=Persicitalea jodogahamensis TaxID=402147 RepID=A0A8J3D9A6_9BACT|nr:M20/M25/M40 family metallo-hydrolase [Persicitalea jodogahamensis]GHB78636.1 aminopeptidase [Persicitalea jodogahamensis]